jgi:predicted DNA-binding transcriptional regulator AlpA
MSPCLDDPVRDPARAGLLSSEKRQALLAQAASLLVVLASSGVTGDRLLTVKDAAHKLGCAGHTLYRNKRHPARVPNGRPVRFSVKAIETFIRQRRGRAA